ncbi:hypothetical protein E4U36_005781 [Claviceps purpurea]|nr:hypothetical protein E4U36_005781 [Claviceps purpurea]
MYLSVAQQRPPHHPAKIKQEEDPGWKRSVAVLLPRFLSVAQGALFAKAHDERPICGNDVVSYHVRHAMHDARPLQTKDTMNTPERYLEFFSNWALQIA